MGELLGGAFGAGREGVHGWEAYVIFSNVLKRKKLKMGGGATARTVHVVTVPGRRYLVRVRNNAFVLRYRYVLRYNTTTTPIAPPLNTTTQATQPNATCSFCFCCPTRAGDDCRPTQSMTRNQFHPLLRSMSWVVFPFLLIRPVLLVSTAMSRHRLQNSRVEHTT